MIRSLQNAMPEFDQWRTGDQSSTAFQSTQVGLSRSQSMDIVLYTQEGDKVTLSSASQYEARYATYEGLANAGNRVASGKGESFDLSAAGQFSLTIEGDLNDQEKADIGKALNTIDEMMKDLISGDFGKIMDRSMSFGGLETLQSLSADLQVSESVYAQYQEGATLAADQGQAPRPLTESASPKGVSTKAVEDAAVNEMAEALPASDSLMERMISYLDRYFTELENRLGESDKGNPGNEGVVGRVKSNLFKKIDEMSKRDMPPLA